jgi:dipeptidyl aminopeptidase/acylaminoacyl peptidase
MFKCRVFNREAIPMKPIVSRLLALSCLGWLAASSVAAPRRVLESADFGRMLDVDNLACSRDGRWILYTVEGANRDADERRSALWMVNWEGTEHVRLSAPTDSASDGKFSPDGRRVAFLSERGADGKTQIYVLDRRGGEAEALTAVTGDIGDYDWSPDGTRLVMSMAPGDATAAGGKAPKPIVIDRVRFKEDKKGYVTAADRAQLYLLDVATKKMDPLTTDARFDDSLPVWSPDGTSIAFFSNHGSDPDTSGVQELFVVEAHPGAVPRKLAESFAPNKASLLWTRDGRRLIFTRGAEPRINSYMQDHLSTVSLADGHSRPLTDALDRAVSAPALTGGGAIAVILEDDRNEVPALLRMDTGAIGERLPGRLSTTSLCSGAGHVAVVAATDGTAPEVHAWEAGRLRRLTSHNDALMAELSLGAVDDIEFTSRDGTPIHGMLVKPPDYRPGQTYPTLLWIHGGPNGQDAHGLNFSTYALAVERQWFAAHGYVVLAINYRGSSGRGLAFAKSIAADWGDLEVADLMAGVDYAVRQKIADPDRLGVGGWSYGGLLTDYTIASDARFKAAVSGAGSGNQVSMFGSDQYILQYDAELGAPWRATDLWLKVSYPFFHADRITTPTLFLGGEKDFNVPVAGGEQMYEALRTLGVPTQLVVYPGQYHLFTRPSYIEDRAARYLAWFDRYLAPPAR